jgi:transposase
MTKKLTKNTTGTSVDPETLAKPKKRLFKKEVKMAVLDEIDRNPGETGLILRREGLYSSHLYQWRQWREKMGISKTKDTHNELAKANRKIVNLELKLKKAEAIIDLQKKISALMDLDQKENLERA